MVEEGSAWASRIPVNKAQTLFHTVFLWGHGITLAEPAHLCRSEVLRRCKVVTGVYFYLWVNVYVWRLAPSKTNKLFNIEKRSYCCLFAATCCSMTLTAGKNACVWTHHSVLRCGSISHCQITTTPTYNTLSPHYNFHSTFVSSSWHPAKILKNKITIRVWRWYSNFHYYELRKTNEWNNLIYRL